MCQKSLLLQKYRLLLRLTVPAAVLGIALIGAAPGDVRAGERPPYDPQGIGDDAPPDGPQRRYPGPMRNERPDPPYMAAPYGPRAYSPSYDSPRDRRGYAGPSPDGGRYGPRRPEPELPLAPDFELNRHRGFGRLFPVLDPAAPDGRGLPAQGSPLGALRALGAVLVEPGDPDDPAGNSDMPSGYTFLGLLIDHDLTLDLSTSLSAGVRGDEVENTRTPELDLDNIYGADPTGSPFLYRLPYLRTGRLLAGEGPYARHDVLRIDGSDGPGPLGGTPSAVLGDPRDDENLVISQLHAAVVALHNRTVDVLVSRRFGRQRYRYCGSNLCSIYRLADSLPAPAKTAIFETARDHVLHYYHRVIAEDFLPWLIGYRATADLFARGRDFYFPRGFRAGDGGLQQPYIPVEFAVAAFRYGHSQVRYTYQLREGYRANLFALARGRGGIPAFSPVTPRELVDWRYFFEIEEAPPPGFNWARRINPLVTPELQQLNRTRVVGPRDLGSLPARSMQRGRVFYLPPGQAVAERMLPVLAARGALGPSGPGWQGFVVPPSERVHRYLGPDEASPLWYYVLQEAEVFGISRGAYYTPAYAMPFRRGYQPVGYRGGPGGPRGGYAEGGNSLGPVGGAIVGEVLVGLLEHFRERTGNGLAYRPEVRGSLSQRPEGPPRYLMRNFLIDAGVAGRY